MQYLVIALFAVVSAAVVSGAAASAQPQPQATVRHAVPLVKLPNGDYTFPMSELQGSGTSGTVRLHPQGLRTVVIVTVSSKAARKHVFDLHSGADCAALETSRRIALAPAVTGQPSQTIVALPIEDLTKKDYVVAAHDATARAQFHEACARL